MSVAVPATRLARRVIACLDIRDGRVVKGTKFRDHEDLGNPMELARRHRDQGADEIVCYDIAASARGEVVARRWIDDIARDLDIPLCVAGGIRSLAHAAAVLDAGADKVSVNSPALARPALVDELVAEFGSQCIVVGVDSRRDGDSVWRVRQYAGDEATMRNAGRATTDWVSEAVERGAGEVVLNCMDSDGTRDGFDLEQLAAVRAVCDVPLVASGGAGRPQDFVDAFCLADADAALAAGALHRGQLTIPDIKAAMGAAGLEVRS